MKYSLEYQNLLHFRFELASDLKAEEKQVVRKLKSLDRSGLRSQLSDALSEDEMEILFILLLRLLGFELR